MQKIKNVGLNVNYINLSDFIYYSRINYKQYSGSIQHTRD